MLLFRMVHPRANADHLGLIPYFFSDTDSRSAAEQINDRYAHGGGWIDLRVGTSGFRMIDGKALKYPGDPKMARLAEATLHLNHVPGNNPPPEVIGIYEHGYVSIEQADGSFRVSRLD